MTFTGVLLVCLFGIAACSLLVFLVETLVAFWFQPDVKTPPVTLQMPVRLTKPDRRKAA